MTGVGTTRWTEGSGIIEFICDLSLPGSRFQHCWEHTVGSCHAPLALRADWQAQLKQCHSELGFQYVRFHGLLSDDIGTIVRQQKRLIYSFFNADRIIDFLLSIGMRPFVELSFMPTLTTSMRPMYCYTDNQYSVQAGSPQDRSRAPACRSGLEQHRPAAWLYLAAIEVS